MCHVVVLSQNETEPKGCQWWASKVWVRRDFSEVSSIQMKVLAHRASWMDKKCAGGVVPWTHEICVWWGWLGRREAKLPGSAWPLVRNRTRERARDGLAVVHWRHRPLSWGECGGCTPAFEALPPTNSGLPTSTHCVDTPHPPIPPSPSLCFPYKAWPFPQQGCTCMRVCGHCVNWWRTITSLFYWICLGSNDVQYHHARSLQFHPCHRCYERLQIPCSLVKLLASDLCKYLWQLLDQLVSSSVKNVTDWSTVDQLHQLEYG